jgi:hypothetical protein
MLVGLWAWKSPWLEDHLLHNSSVTQLKLQILAVLLRPFCSLKKPDGFRNTLTVTLANCSDSAAIPITLMGPSVEIS